MIFFSSGALYTKEAGRKLRQNGKQWQRGFEKKKSRPACRPGPEVINIFSCSTQLRGARWPGGQCLGLRIQRSGVRVPLGSNRVVSLSRAHLLPKNYW